jgi:tetratricopeptide (TPR) repeat protein
VSNTFAQGNRYAGVNANLYGGAYGHRGGAWGGYYGRAAWNTGWYGGSWAGYWNRPAGWYPRAVPYGWIPAAAGLAYAYANPYYTAPAVGTTVVQPVYNYSEPLPTPPVQVSAPVDVPVTLNVTVPPGTPGAPEATTNAAVTPAGPPEVDQTTQDAVTHNFTAARDAFMRGEYVGAQATCEKAIKALPGDPSLHEFLGLTLFAQGKYAESAGVVYAVLAAQPGWNYETMRALYPDTETYTKQLRALEAYQKANPTRGDVCFLLAYHYLTLEEKDAAVEMLRLAVKNEPKDTLSAALLKSLTEPQPPPTPGDGSK